MDRRVKYSIKQKVAAVRSILRGRSSIRGAARELGCEKGVVRSWLARYKQDGIKGIQFRNGRYEPSFKLLVVRSYLEKGLSLNQAATYFKIPNIGVISRWVTLYKHGGAEGLLPRTKGRKKRAMSKKPTKKASQSSDEAASKLTKLQKEVEYLRAENAFLKKFEALVQQEKAAKAQAGRQKPSKN